MEGLGTVGASMCGMPYSSRDVDVELLPYLAWERSGEGPAKVPVHEHVRNGDGRFGNHRHGRPHSCADS
jgi:hypothetical protein